MKECKDDDPERTDRVSIWLYIRKRIKRNYKSFIPLGIEYNNKNISERYIDKFQISR